MEFLVGGELFAVLAGKLREGAARNAAFVDVQAEKTFATSYLPCRRPSTGAWRRRT